MITLDDRQGSKELLQYLPDGTAELGHLQYGDASFVGNGPDGLPYLIGIERKTLGDLINSVRRGRLQGQQLPGLVNAYNKVYLIVEGIFKAKNGKLWQYKYGHWAETGGMGAKAYLNLINSLTVFAGVIIHATPGIQETADLIYYLYEWWQKPWDQHRGHLGFYDGIQTAIYLRKPSLLRMVAKELPGIGWERSLSVARHFSSIGEMCAADEKEWQKIKGVGKRLAKQVFEAIHGSS